MTILKATIIWGLLVLSAPVRAQTLAITSPNTGVLVEPGQNVTVNVSGTYPPVNGSELLIVSDPIAAPAVQTSGTANQFSLSIPSTISPGSYSVTAVESSPNGPIVSNSITLTVQPNYSFDLLAADVTSILFTAPGEELPLVVHGSKSGVSQLVRNEFLTFASANTAIAVVDANGIVSPVSAGTTQVTMSYGKVSGTVAVTVGSAIVAQGQTPAPTFAPAGGVFPSVQTVTLADSSAGTAIYYTTDGTAPSTTSLLYTGPFTVSSTETVNAIAIASGYTESAAVSASYTINIPPTASTPTFAPPAGTYSSIQSVTISDTTAGATIYYTTNGATPTAGSMLYSGPIPVSSSETIQAIAVASGYTNSGIAAASYTINIPVAAIPTFTPAPGTFTSVQTVTITDATPGAVIHFTIDGSTPSASSPVYTAPIVVSSTKTIQAIAVATGYTSSGFASAVYTINIPVAATPSFSPTAGTFTSVQTVSIADSTSGAVMHFSVDGSTPTALSPVYAGPITVSSTETIQAIAIASGYTNSGVASGMYTIHLPQDFTVGLSTSEMAVSAGQSGTATITIAAVNGFNQPVTLGCSGLPAILGLTCSFSPPSPTPNGSTATSQLTIQESAVAEAARKAGSVQFAGVFGILTLAVFAVRGERRRIGLFTVFIGAVLSVLAIGCGGGSTTNMTITATSGAVVHSVPLTLTLK